jgi:hypothetical protein
MVRTLKTTGGYAHLIFTIILGIACALRPDLELLPNGDMTEVGEKGIPVVSSYGDYY